MNYSELFQQYFDECEGDVEDYFYRCYGEIHNLAVAKGLEFEGYFKSKYQLYCANPVSFDENYFNNNDRISLYVYMSALQDNEVFSLLNDVYKIIGSAEFTENLLHREIYKLEELGVGF